LAARAHLVDGIAAEPVHRGLASMGPRAGRFLPRTHHAATWSTSRPPGRLAASHRRRRAPEPGNRSNS